MSPRVERGVVVETDGWNRGTVALDSGGRVSYRPVWSRHEVGTRVVVTYGVKGDVVRVGLDLAGIGMTELEASDLARVGARFDELLAQGPLTDEQRGLFTAALAMHANGANKAVRQLHDRIERALAGDFLPISAEDAWAAAARTELETIAARDAWIELLAQAGDGARPTKKWLAAAGAGVSRIGVPAFVDTVRRWFGLVATREVRRDERNWFAPAIADANVDALRNLVWACCAIDPETHARELEQLAVAVGDLAVRCFTKVRGVGALSAKVGNACIHVLSQLPGMRAVAQLSRLGARVRYRQALALIDKAKLECARRAGMEPIDLEELALPTFGLDVTGRTRIELGADHAAVLATDGSDATLVFYAGEKALKSVPAAVKAEHADELKELKATHKELAALMPTLRWRIERWFAEPRTWTLADLRARYIDHPLVAPLARRLIYTTADGVAAIFVDGFPLDVRGTQLHLADDTPLSLWHPLGRAAGEIAAWRALFAELELVQPIKQLDRELYSADDDDRDAVASARFAGHRLRQHQLAALCRERGWSCQLSGAGYDGGSAPRKALPADDLEVVLGIDFEDDAPLSDAGIYVHVVSGNVRFLRKGHAVALGTIAPRCFSEVLRDVDMFVAKSRIAE